MRSLLHLLTLVALLFAPLAAPAMAVAPAGQAAECQNMGMGHGDHEMPVGDQTGGACCVAVCAAVVAAPLITSEIDPIGHLPFQSLAAAFRLGSGPSTDDPPPRLA